MGKFMNKKDTRKALWKIFRKAGMEYNTAVKVAAVLASYHDIRSGENLISLPVDFFTSSLSSDDFKKKGVKIEVIQSRVHYPTEFELEVDDDYLQWFKIEEGVIKISGSSFIIKNHEVLFTPKSK